MVFKRKSKRRRLDDANNDLLQSSLFKILVQKKEGLTGSDKRLGRVEPGAKITPGACQQLRSSSEHDLNFLQKWQEIVVLDQKG